MTRKLDRVLVVEDEKEAAVLLREVMAEAYEVATAGTIAEGLTKMEGVHAILLDLRLPNGQGCAVIRSFHEPHPNVPIVVLTGCDVNEPEAKAAGARRILRKPQESLAVIGALHMAIAGPQAAESAARKAKEMMEPALATVQEIKSTQESLASTGKEGK